MTDYDYYSLRVYDLRATDEDRDNDRDIDVLAVEIERLADAIRLAEQLTARWDMAINIEGVVRTDWGSDRDELGWVHDGVWQADG